MFFCNIIQKAVMLYIKLKKMKRRKLAPTPPPPPPPHLHQKRPYTYIARHQENQRFPKPIEVNLKNRLPTCEHKLSHFEPTIYLKSKLQIQNTITKLPMSTTTATVHTFLPCIIHCMGLGTKMLAANAQLVMAKVAYILASNVHILVENHKT